MDANDDVAPIVPQGGVVVPLVELGDELTHDNFGPSVGACVWALAALAAGWLALRIYLKSRKHWGLWWDDHFLTIVKVKVQGYIPASAIVRSPSPVPLIARQICIVLSNISTSVAISLGWGQQPYDIPPHIWSRILLALLISGAFSILAAAMSKTSFALTLLRISSGWVKYTVWFAILTTNVAMGLSLIFNWVQSYSGAVDILLALLPWKIIWNMDMSRKERFGAICAMSLGIFAGTIALAKIYSLIGTFQEDLNSSVQLTVLAIAESAVTIMAASIPILRALTRGKKTPGGARLFTLNVTKHLTLRRLSDPQSDAPDGENSQASATAKGPFRVVRKTSGRRAPALSRIIESEELSPGLFWGTASGERSFV
ncbi:hypothetical protein EKO27_g9454 [Xylaria grammica]|uniref:Rhodopsin domain-containing protein n=1 Tax=Xylaria grammica TaxID=363999 RepID=A0A439CU03_9PEZI|nr:hypothetical protein EKO27_g9454 [Xylaria grammica]